MRLACFPVDFLFLFLFFFLSKIDSFVGKIWALLYFSSMCLVLLF